MAAKASTFKFKAEINQVLDILIHSLYTNKDIFLRELVSNASDALDKLRFMQNQGLSVTDEDLELAIRIGMDKDAGTLTIADTGVGMTRQELVDNIGTIAHSGSAEFIKQAAENKESLDNLIGRFGVGFYSVFMVAEEVSILTRSAHGDQPAQTWTSDGKTSFKIKEQEGEVKRGTTITVKLKEDYVEEFTDPEAIKRIVKAHSNFISFPIYVGEDRVNTIPAIWREPKFQIKQEQYDEFYKFLTLDTEDPARTMHVSVDAPVQFSSLLFIPKKEWDIFGMDRENWGLDLYVRRVLIQRQNKDLMPQYMSFVKGVVDTEDLPLNVSRETLQGNILIRKIADTLTKHVLKELARLADEDADKYADFWREHAKTFKLGYNDFVNRERFAPLLRFNSSADQDAGGLTSLDQYVERAKEGQKAVYYVSAQSREAAVLNPHLEIFRKKGIEVLYLYEPIDEFVMETVRTYKDFEMTPAEHAKPEDLDAFQAEEKADESKAEPLDQDQLTRMGALLAAMKSALGDRVTEVKASARLSDSPCCLTNPDGAMTSSMEKIMRVMSKDQSVPQKVLEVNQDHPLIRNLLEVFTRNPEDPFVAQVTEQLFESSLLLEGYLTDPHALVGRIQDLLTRSSGWYARLEDR